jgi:hypothetical protein
MCAHRALKWRQAPARRPGPFPTLHEDAPRWAGAARHRDEGGTDPARAPRHGRVRRCGPPAASAFRPAVRCGFRPALAPSGPRLVAGRIGTRHGCRGRHYWPPIRGNSPRRRNPPASSFNRGRLPTPTDSRHAARFRRDLMPSRMRFVHRTTTPTITSAVRAE